jgi:hypothetical protein
MVSKIVSMRVTAREAAAIDRLAVALGTNRSGVLKRALAVLRQQVEDSQSSHERGIDLFGRHGSGREDGSTHRHERFREIVRTNHGRR